MSASSNTRSDSEVKFDLSNRALCFQMIKRGRGYCRCHSPREAGSIFCSEHKSSRHIGTDTIYMPTLSAPEPNPIPRQTQCFGYNYLENNQVIRCSKKPTPTSREGKYCSNHAYSYRLDSEAECAICAEINDETKNVPLHCGHVFHFDCLRRYGKDTCAKCRAKMTPQEAQRYISAQSEEKDETNINETVNGILICYARIMFRLDIRLQYLAQQPLNDSTLRLLTLLISSDDLSALIACGTPDIQQSGRQIGELFENCPELQSLVYSQSD